MPTKLTRDKADEQLRELRSLRGQVESLEQAAKDRDERDERIREHLAAILRDLPTHYFRRICVGP